MTGTRDAGTARLAAVAGGFGAGVHGARNAFSVVSSSGVTFASGCSNQESRQRHRSKLDHVYGFVERRLLRGSEFGSEGREVEVLTRGQDIVPHQPVAWHDMVEP